jgi:OOP family OmpA-OmpF porin
MKRCFIWLLLCITPFGVVCQNIITNGGFEEITSCPSSSSEIFLAPPWHIGRYSPDLMNACCLNEWGTMVNRYGGQTPKSGLGYSHIISNIPSISNYNEIITQPLKYQLSANETYYFELYVSLGDSFKYATHNVGVVFTDTFEDILDLPCLFDCQPVVENTSANPLTSKTEWIKISGTFTAQGWEKYIFIGNMRPDSLTEIEFVGGSVGNGQYTWEESGYYVDDVWLSHIDSMHYAGLDESVMVPINVWPNPTQGELSVDLGILGKKTCLLKVFDPFGRTVVDLNTKTLVIQLDLTPFARGPYMMVVRDSEGRMAVQRIMKE